MDPRDPLDTLPADTPRANSPLEDTLRPDTLPTTIQRAAGLEPARLQEVTGGRFRPVRLLGTGGLGRVFEAVDTMLERPVAIKVLHSSVGDEAAGLRFLREARAMARVIGHYVLRIYDVGIGAGDVPFIVMELVDCSLAELMRGHGPVDPRIATEVVRQVAAGLESLHDHELVHRDVKPSNIFVDVSSARVLLGDFGLARTTGAEPPAGDLAAAAEDRGDVSLTRSGLIIGTPAYMSPEAACGLPVDARSDLYSLGTVFYELLTGELPFRGASLGEMIQHRLHGEVPSPRRFNTRISPAMERIVLRLLEREPEKRFQSAGELRRALARLERLKWWQWRGRHEQESTSLRQWLGGSSVRSRRVEADPALVTSLDEPRAVPESNDAGPRRAERPDENQREHAEPDRFQATIMLPALSVGDVQPPPAESVEPALPTAWLMVPGDDGEEAQVRLGDETLIGRDSACDVAVARSWMSRRHFAIRMGEDGFYLEDLGSANGTYVNEQRVSRTRLVDRDRIQAGGKSMLFIQTVLSERETAALRRLRLLDEAWHECFAGEEAGRPPDIATLARRLTHGPLREALGYQIQHEVPAYRDIAGYVVEAPMLWIRQTRFPILFVPVSDSLAMEHVMAQLQAACATDYLALLVAVPPAREQGGVATDLRRLVADSVYRYDLAVLDRADLARILRSGDSKTLIELFIEQGIAPARLSPYVIRGPVPENMFFGREAEIKELSQNLRNHAIVGSRRMGKSSILLRLCRLLGRDPRHRAFYVNCEACFDHADFLATFSAALATPAIDAVTDLRASVTAIARQHTGKTVVFLLDEVDELVAFDARSQTPGRLFKTLRALSHEQISHFVFSGGRTLHDALHDPHSPFFNFCEDVRLSPLSRHNVAEIVLKPMRQLSIALADEQAIIDRVFTVTSGHPNLVQYLCDRLVNQGGERRITPAMVDEVVSSQAFVDHFMETAWSQSTPLEKLITLLPTEVTFTRDWLLQRLGERGIADRDAIDSALETLSLYALIQRDGERLRFVLQHFPMAVRRREVDGEIAAQLMELQEGACSSSTAR